MMITVVLTVTTVVVATSALELTPQPCLNETAGGLGCRCATRPADLVNQWEVDCSSLNISNLSSEWQISPEAVHLDLSRNKLFSLSNEQFSRWGNLEELSLARNKFASLNEDVFLGLGNLRVLDLSFNMLTTLPAKIFNGLSILSTLNLEMNRLQELSPELFLSTPHLDSLTLSYNTALGKYLMKSQKFLTIILQKDLGSLALNNMSIDKIPDHLFDGARNLRHLSLADNPMKVINILPPSLETLNLSGIDVTVLVPGNFIYYPKLKQLHLDRLIHLRTVQENGFEGLTSLEVLTMENCIQLHTFDELAFSSSIPLKRLSLARSGLHSLSGKTFLPLNRTLEHLDLQGNPWRCDCKMAWLRQSNFSLQSTEYLRCFSPDKHHNKLLLSVDVEDFKCTHQASKYNYSGLMVVMDVILILMVSIVGGATLAILWRRGLIPCIPRQTVGTYSQVTVEPSRADLEWDDKDLEHIWSTPSSIKQNVPKGF